MSHSVGHGMIHDVREASTEYTHCHLFWSPVEALVLGSCLNSCVCQSVFVPKKVFLWSTATLVSSTRADGRGNDKISQTWLVHLLTGCDKSTGVFMVTGYVRTYICYYHVTRHARFRSPYLLQLIILN